MLTTRLCTLLGIDFPIINAPMAGTATAALATAVSKAAAFGMMGKPDSHEEKLATVRKNSSLSQAFWGDAGSRVIQYKMILKATQGGGGTLRVNAKHHAESRTSHASPLFSSPGEAKCVRGASAGGARRLTSAGVLESTLSTASKRNEVMAGLSRASVGRW